MKKETIFFTADNLELKRFKGIDQFKGRLNGECCIIVGSEAAGKSNLLMAISMVLRQYPSAILKQGEEDGKVNIEISRGETKYLFKFSFDEDDDIPKLKTLIDGEKLTVAKQTEVIKSLTPKTFDLDELITAKGQKQADLILTAFDIDVVKEIETYSEAFQERKFAKHSLEEASHFEVKTEIKEVDTKALREELNKANTEKGIIRDAETKLNSYRDRLKELEEEQKNLNIRLKAIQGSIKKGEDYLKVPRETKDVEKLEEKLSNAEVINERTREYKEYLTKIETKKKKQTIVQQWETKIKEATKAITDKINSKKLPVPKLNIATTISETSGRINSVLTYDGLPFDDESINTAERIAISARLQMSLFKEGNLGIITLNAGSVGNNTIKSISEECAKQGMQVLWELTSKDDDKKLEITTVLKK